jgi:hypothetical protein
MGKPKPEGRRRGRSSTKYCEERVSAICTALELTGKHQSAYRAAEIGHTTYNEWLNIYPEFRVRVDRALDHYNRTNWMALRKLSSEVKALALQRYLENIPDISTTIVEIESEGFNPKTGEIETLTEKRNSKVYAPPKLPAAAIRIVDDSNEELEWMAKGVELGIIPMRLLTDALYTLEEIKTSIRTGVVAHFGLEEEAQEIGSAEEQSRLAGEAIARTIGLRSDDNVIDSGSE